MSYAYEVDHDTGAYCCEEGVTVPDICAHFQISEPELYECNGGCEPDCSYGCTIYLPEKCYKSEYSNVNYSHKAEETAYSSEQCATDTHVGGGHGYAGGYGGHGCETGGEYDAEKQHSSVNYSHKSEETAYSSEQGSESAHIGGSAVHVPSIPDYKPPAVGYKPPTGGY